MNKIIALLMVITWTASSLFLQGCAQDKAFVKKDAAAISPIKCIRYETPPILRSTMAETFFLTAAVALPGGSALLVLSDEYAKARGEEMQMKIPDFGYLVMSKFIDKMSQEKTNWPELTVENKPVKEEYTESCTLVEFKVNRLAYGYLDFVRGGGNGFLSKTVVTMKDSTGDVLWQRNFTYLSKDFNRDKDINEFEADNGRLLKDELEFAAEKTASDFYQHLNGGKL